MNKEEILQALSSLVGDLTLLQSDAERGRRKASQIADIAEITRTVKRLRQKIEMGGD